MNIFFAKLITTRTQLCWLDAFQLRSCSSAKICRRKFDIFHDSPANVELCRGRNLSENRPRSRCQRISGRWNLGRRWRLHGSQTESWDEEMWWNWQTFVRMCDFTFSRVSVIFWKFLLVTSYMSSSIVMVMCWLLFCAGEFLLLDDSRNDCSSSLLLVDEKFLFILSHSHVWNRFE